MTQAAGYQKAELLLTSVNAAGPQVSLKTNEKFCVFFQHPLALSLRAKIPLKHASCVGINHNHFDLN